MNIKEIRTKFKVNTFFLTEITISAILLIIIFSYFISITSSSINEIKNTSDKIDSLKNVSSDISNKLLIYEKNDNDLVNNIMQREDISENILKENLYLNDIDSLINNGLSIKVDKMTNINNFKNYLTPINGTDKLDIIRTKIRYKWSEFIDINDSINLLLYQKVNFKISEINDNTMILRHEYIKSIEKTARQTYIIIASIFVLLFILILFVIGDINKSNRRLNTYKDSTHTLIKLFEGKK